MIPSRARRLRRALLLALGVALVATACSGTGGSASSASSSGGAPLVVGLTYTADIQFSPFYVAAEKGYFADEGLDVTLRHHGGSEPLLGALQAGDEDVVYAGGDEMMVNRSQGVDVVDVATIYQSYPGELIVPADSPITSLADLRGHSIGVPGEYGETWYTLLALLDEAGLSRDDVDIRTIGFTQQSALMTGKVDAVVGFSNNDAVQFEQAGFGIREIAPGEGTPWSASAWAPWRTPSPGGATSSRACCARSAAPPRTVPPTRTGPSTCPPGTSPRSPTTSSARGPGRPSRPPTPCTGTTSAPSTTTGGAP